MYFLIEPYNAYTSKPRKRHPLEIAEEEALFYRIVQEQQRQEQLRESLKQQQTQEDAISKPLTQQITQEMAIEHGAGAGGRSSHIPGRVFSAIEETFGSIPYPFSEV
jgi:hypothetical protein